LPLFQPIQVLTCTRHESIDGDFDATKTTRTAASYFCAPALPIAVLNVVNNGDRHFVS
jgi:hypothetical protein